MDTSKLREIKAIALIQRVEITTALAADNKARKRLNARVVFIYDDVDNDTETAEDDVQTLLASGQSGNAYSTIVDLQAMKFAEDVVDRLAKAKEIFEGKRAKFSTFVAAVEDITAGKSAKRGDGETVSLACSVCNDGVSREMQSQSVSYVGWKTTKEYAAERIERRFWQRIKSKKLFLGELKRENVAAPKPAEKAEPELKQADDNVIDDLDNIL